jgi:hypothetical protein
MSLESLLVIESWDISDSRCLPKRETSSCVCSWVIRQVQLPKLILIKPFHTHKKIQIKIYSEMVTYLQYPN